MSEGPVFEGELDAEVEARQSYSDSLAQISAAKFAEFQGNIEDLIRQTRGELASLGEEQTMTTSRQLGMTGQVFPQFETVQIVEDLAADSMLALPLSYTAGRNCLLVFKNGLLQIPNADWLETGGAGIVCDEIQIREQSLEGDVWAFYLLPLNTSQTATNAAHEAAGYAREAQEALYAMQSELAALRAKLAEYESRAQGATASIAAQNLIATQDINENIEAAESGASEAQAWANAAAASAQDAWAASAEAYKAKTLAQLAAAKPGIKAVPSRDHINAPGVYIIIPELDQPTDFMGIYAAESTDDMTFDGVFFIAKPSTLPEFPLPARPGIGGGVQQLSGYDGWVPCSHTHNGG